MSNRRIRRPQASSQSPQLSQHSTSQPYHSGQPIPPPANQPCVPATGEKKHPVLDAKMTLMGGRLYKRLMLFTAPTSIIYFLANAIRCINYDRITAKHDLIIGLVGLISVLLGLFGGNVIKDSIDVSVAKLTPEHWFGNEQEFLRMRAYSQKHSGFIALLLGVLLGVLLGMYGQLLPKVLLYPFGIISATSTMVLLVLGIYGVVHSIYEAIKAHWRRRWNQQHGIDP